MCIVYKRCLCSRFIPIFLLFEASSIVFFIVFTHNFRTSLVRIVPSHFKVYNISVFCNFFGTTNHYEVIFFRIIIHFEVFCIKIWNMRFNQIFYRPIRLKQSKNFILQNTYIVLQFYSEGLFCNQAFYTIEKILSPTKMTHILIILTN